MGLLTYQVEGELGTNWKDIFVANGFDVLQSESAEIDEPSLKQIAIGEWVNISKYQLSNVKEAADILEITNYGTQHPTRNARFQKRGIVLLPVEDLRLAYRLDAILRASGAAIHYASRTTQGELFRTDLSINELIAKLNLALPTANLFAELRDDTLHIPNEMCVKSMSASACLLPKCNVELAIAFCLRLSLHKRQLCIAVMRMSRFKRLYMKGKRTTIVKMLRTIPELEEVL